MTKQQIDPWTGGLFSSTKQAQKAFDSSHCFDDDQLAWANEYHHNCANASDRARIDALDGDWTHILAWYWDDSYRAETREE